MLSQEFNGIKLAITIKNGGKMKFLQFECMSLFNLTS